MIPLKKKAKLTIPHISVLGSPIALAGTNTLILDSGTGSITNGKWMCIVSASILATMNNANMDLRFARAINSAAAVDVKQAQWIYDTNPVSLDHTVKEISNVELVTFTGGTSANQYEFFGRIFTGGTANSLSRSNLMMIRLSD